MYPQHVRAAAVALRKTGKMYREINAELGIAVPKGTMSEWFKDVVYSDEVREQIENSVRASLFRAQKIAVARKRERRKLYFLDLERQNEVYRDALKDHVPAKIALAMMYLGEGMKSLKHGMLQIANSDPDFIRLFLSLFRKCYSVDESKFRMTVQCRADQDTVALTEFWSGVSGVPHNQFYKPQIDPRTLGKPTLKMDYKGVFRIAYLNAATFHDLLMTAKVMKEGLIV